MKLKEINLRDPFVLPEDGKYYLYGSRGSSDFDKMLGFDVYLSNDLENWSNPTEVFSASEDFWATKCFWAPEVHKYQGKYYMLASFKSDVACRGVQILVSDTPDGRFIPLTDKPITPQNWECLDGTLYIDKSGNPYMVFCHEWLQVHNGEIYAVELSRDLKCTVSKPFLLFKASEPVWASKGKEDYVTDGPFMYRTESGRLLMLWSSLVNDSYVEAISYSDDDEITGTWEHLNEPLFEKDGGHGMIFQSFEGQKYFICHCPNEPLKERPTLIKVKDCNGDIVKVC